MVLLMVEWLALMTVALMDGMMVVMKVGRKAENLDASKVVL
jgi:hypothetical protein